MTELYVFFDLEFLGTADIFSSPTHAAGTWATQ